MQQEKTSWNCEECTSDISSRRSTIFNLPNSESQGISEIKTMIRELQGELREFRNAMEFLNEKFEEERKRSQILSDMVTEVTKDNALLKERVGKLETALNMQQNENIKNNIVIGGLIRGDGNNAKKQFAVLMQHLEVPITTSDVSDFRVFETKSGPKATVTLQNSELKNRILKARSQKGKITIRKLGLGEEDSPIFVSEELTKECYALFQSAKALKEKNYRYVWHRGGKVFARKQEGEKVIWIKHENILNELLA